MEAGVSCTVSHYDDFPDGVTRERLRYGDETHAMLKLQYEHQKGAGFEWYVNNPPGDIPTWEQVRAALAGFAAERPCPDCACPGGGYHHPGCDNEECPQCHRQALSCACPPTER